MTWPARPGTSGGQPDFGVNRAMVTARQVVYRGCQHGAPGIDEDMIESEQCELSCGPPCGGQPITCPARGVDVPEAQQPAELRVIGGGVEVPGEQAGGICWGRQDG